jgi:hypothetical protein
MNVLISQNHFKMLVEQSNKTPKEELDNFNYNEDKVKSAYIGKKRMVGWYNRLKEKYPSLKIRFQKDGEVVRAEAEIDKQKITEEITKDKVICDKCGWEWSLEDGGDDPYMCHKCGHNNVNTEDFLGKKVMVYFNLNKKTFSVTFKGKVIMYADYVKLSNVEFRVRQGGKEKVRKEKVKNVHAFVIGNLEDFCEYPCKDIPIEKDENIVTYDPYQFDTFVYKSSKEPVYGANEVEMINRKNKLFVIKEVKL